MFPVSDFLLCKSSSMFHLAISLMQRVFEHLIIIIIIIIIIVMCSKKCFFFFLVKKLSCAVDKRMDAKRKPHRAHSVTYAI